MDSSKLIAKIKSFVNLSQTESEKLTSCLIRIELKKGDKFLCIGQQSDKIGFVVNGTLEMTMESDGNEVSIDFFLPNTFVSDYVSFISHEPSPTNITALKRTTILTINREDLENLYKSSIQFQKLGRMISEYFFIDFAKRIRDRELSIKERYNKLLKEKPQYLQEIPQYKIASFLGVSPEWLSKIRARK